MSFATPGTFALAQRIRTLLPFAARVPKGPCGTFDGAVRKTRHRRPSRQIQADATPRNHPPEKGFRTPSTTGESALNTASTGTMDKFPRFVTPLNCRSRINRQGRTDIGLGPRPLVRTTLNGFVIHWQTWFVRYRRKTRVFSSG